MNCAELKTKIKDLRFDLRFVSRIFEIGRKIGFEIFRFGYMI